MRRLWLLLREFFVDAVKTSLILFRIMIPVSIVIKILKETGVIEVIGTAFGPVMESLGLPGAMGLVWVTGMVTNLYGGILAFVSLSNDYPLTVAQATVLTTMMLVAHSLPVELQVARKAGASLLAMLVLRVGCAYFLGMLLVFGYRLTGTLENLSVISWASSSPVDSSWASWVFGELRNYAMIFLVICALLLLMAILKKIGVISLMNRLFGPVLSFIGIGREVTALTIVGMTLGISYGGALIIREAETGRIARRDLFFSMAFLGLCHSLIEDTLLMMSLGGHWSGLFVARALFAVAVVGMIVRLAARMDERHFATLFLSGR